MIQNIIEFPNFKGIRCNMMPFIQGDSSSIPKEYKSYASIIDNNYLEKGELGWLTIDEKFVEIGKSQRGYNNKNINRNVHIEVGVFNNSYKWGSDQGYGWGGKPNVSLKEDTMVLIANNIDNTCRYWNNLEKRFTQDGDLSEYISDYPEKTGVLLKSGELAKINILTPHECVNQNYSSNRQFIRIVGKGVEGREDYFTINPLLK